MLDPLAVLNAVMAGVLLGGFYAAVALGIAIAFGMLDIPNLSHPAFVVVGAFATWLLNSNFGLDPVLAGLVMAPPFFVLGALLYRLYHVCFERRGDAALQGLAFFFGMLFITEVALVLTAGADYRSVAAPYIGASVSFAGITLPGRMLVPFLVSIAMIGLLHQFLTKSFSGRAIQAVSQDPVALRLMGVEPDAHQDAGLRPGHGNGRYRGLAAHHHPAGRAQHRPRLHRPCLRGRGAGRHGQFLRHAAGQHHPRHHRKHRLGHVEPVVGAGHRLRLPAADARLPVERPAGAQAVSNAWFWALCAALVAALWLAGRLVTNEYVFFMGYAVAQYVLLATAWNLLGGYAGYINFGTAAFFALGAYVSVAINKLVDVPLPVLILAGAVAAGAVGLAMGYLTLKLRGVFFSIATLALAIVAQAAVTNWEFVGGASGAYLLRPSEGPWGGSYVEYLFYLMLVMAVGAVALARTIERSTVGLGLSAIRDDELVAEAYGVPTLRLKLLVTVLSGALMGMAGAPLPFYVAYLDPPSAFNLSYAVNTIAMPLIGGTSTWLGPVIGAVLLTMVQQTAMVTISSAFNLMLVGLLMVAFITLAPNGIVGLVRNLRRRP